MFTCSMLLLGIFNLRGDCLLPLVDYFKLKVPSFGWEKNVPVKMIKVNVSAAVAPKQCTEYTLSITQH